VSIGGVSGRLAAKARYANQLRALPPRVALFHFRARRAAEAAGDEFSLVSATRPTDLAVLLALARGRRRVVELGTATAWTAISLAIADPAREVTSFDPIDRPDRERYLALAGARVRPRLELVAAPGVSGPRDSRAVDLLYIDSSHARQETIEELHAWGPVLGPGALVVLDDYVNHAFPGVREAVLELGLTGERRGMLFVHEVGAS
jgi:predicted O-methyltransferase YrrM